MKFCKALVKFPVQAFGTETNCVAVEQCLFFVSVRAQNTNNHCVDGYIIIHWLQMQHTRNTNAAWYQTMFVPSLVSFPPKHCIPEQDLCVSLFWEISSECHIGEIPTCMFSQESGSSFLNAIRNILYHYFRIKLRWQDNCQPIIS